MSSATPASNLTPAGFHVLLALASERAHGYAIMGFIEDATGGAIRLGPGTLYRTIARLVSDGFVEEFVASDPGAPHDSRRRYYRLTPAGRQAAVIEASLLAKLVQVAEQAGLLPER